MAKNILICDDAAFMRMMIKDILTKNGYNIAGEAENGQKAVEKYAELKPDLVLMDIILPGMSGLDILKEMKGNVDTKNIKVVMLTNFGNDENVKKAVEYGAEDYYMKYNVVPSELPDKLAVLLGENSDSGIKVTG